MFRFSEKTTKIWSYLPFLFDDVITEWKIASNFCGILRKTGLQRARSKASLISFLFSFFSESMLRRREKDLWSDWGQERGFFKCRLHDPGALVTNWWDTGICIVSNPLVKPQLISISPPLISNHTMGPIFFYKVFFTMEKKCLGFQELLWDFALWLHKKFEKFA